MSGDGYVSTADCYPGIRKIWSFAARDKGRVKKILEEIEILMNQEVKQVANNRLIAGYKFVTKSPDVCVRDENNVFYRRWGF